MTSKENERFHELSLVAMDGELRLCQAGKMIICGNVISAKTHIEQAYQVCKRLLNELSTEK